jgi:membrane protein implicated in regulation of membrane protease activity
MQTIRRVIEVLFVLTLAALLGGGIVFVLGQAVALILGQGSWLAFFHDTVKIPMCIAASVCAIAGFLLSYKRSQYQEQPKEAKTR